MEHRLLWAGIGDPGYKNRQMHWSITENPREPNKSETMLRFIMGEPHIQAGGVEETGPEINYQLDAAWRTKYRRYSANVDHFNGPTARTTIIFWQTFLPMLLLM